MSTLEKNNGCELGAWLAGEAKAKYGRLRAYEMCFTQHAAFHKEAARVALAINEGRHAEALAMLEPGTPFYAISSDVCVAIMRLRNEAALSS